MLAAPLRPPTIRGVNTSSLEQLYWRLPYGLRRTLLKTVFPVRYAKLQELRRNAPEHDDAATLRPFVENKCIFIHIPKTAGMSVKTGLFGSNVGFHRKISGYQVIFGQREYNAYFKFAFVRNPWNRVASAYLFLKQGGLHSGDKRWAAEHLAPYPTFDAFVRGWLKPENLRLKHHFVPQVDYVCLPGKHTSELDFIGTYENLRSDYDHVRSVLGIGEALPRQNVTAGKQKDFRSYYTPETRAIVADVYREDIELLGYTFYEPLPVRTIRPRQAAVTSHIRRTRPRVEPQPVRRRDRSAERL